MVLLLFYEVKQWISWLVHVPGWVTLYGWPLLNLAENQITRFHLALLEVWWQQGNSLTLALEFASLAFSVDFEGKESKAEREKYDREKSIYRSLIQPCCISSLLWQHGIVVLLFYEVKQRISWLVHVPGWVTLHGWPLLNLAENQITQFHKGSQILPCWWQTGMQNSSSWRDHKSLVKYITVQK